MEALGKKYEATNKILNRVLKLGTIEKESRPRERSGYFWIFKLTKEKTLEINKLIYDLIKKLDILGNFEESFNNLIKEAGLNPEDPKIIKLKILIENYFKDKFKEL
jgi:predicted transcriptional regulator